MYVVTQAHIQNTLKIEFGNRENEEVEANEKNNWFRIEQLQPEERNKKILKLLRFIAPFLTVFATVTTFAKIEDRQNPIPERIQEL